MRQMKLPIEFRSPYSLNECITRLEAKRSQTYGREVFVDFQSLTENQEAFRLEAHNIWGRGKNFGDGEVVGWLESWPTTGTRVVLEQVRMGHGAYLSTFLVFVVVVGFFIGVFNVLQNMTLLPLAVIIGCIGGWLQWQEMYSSTIDRLMLLIEETLVYYSGQKKKQRRE